MSAVDQVIADAQSAEAVLAAAAPVLAALVPAAAPAAGLVVSISAEALAVIKAIVAWAEAKGSTAAAGDAVAVAAVESRS